MRDKDGEKMSAKYDDLEKRITDLEDYVKYLAGEFEYHTTDEVHGMMMDRDRFYMEGRPQGVEKVERAIHSMQRKIIEGLLPQLKEEMRELDPTEYIRDLFKEWRKKPSSYLPYCVLRRDLEIELGITHGTLKTRTDFLVRYGIVEKVGGQGTKVGYGAKILAFPFGEYLVNALSE